MDYLKLLEYSFEESNNCVGVTSRLDYLSENIFSFTTYDDVIGDLFASKAIEVCRSISDKDTFEYQKTSDGYMWYMIMVNMPFFVDKLEWGSSIRGAWWGIYGDDCFTIESSGLWVDGEQLLELKLDSENWELFIKAIIEFSEVA